MANNEGRVHDWVPFIGTQDKWDYWTGNQAEGGGDGSATPPPTEGGGGEGGGDGGGNMLTNAYNTVESKIRSMDDFDSANFNVQDPEQVLQLQRRLGLKEDGIFGPKTEEAYRGLVNDQRANLGQDPYIHEDASMAGVATDNAEPQGQTWKEKMAQNRQNRYNNRLNTARDRHAAGKRVWNKGFRDIINEEEETQSSIR